MNRKNGENEKRQPHPRSAQYKSYLVWVIIEMRQIGERSIYRLLQVEQLHDLTNGQPIRRVKGRSAHTPRRANLLEILGRCPLLDFPIVFFFFFLSPFIIMHATHGCLCLSDFYKMALAKIGYSFIDNKKLLKNNFSDFFKFQHSKICFSVENKFYF